MRWKDLLTASLKERRTLLCVGLDTDMDRFPPEMRTGDLPQFDRNKEIIDATADIAAAYKLNQAFYEVQGAKGVTALERTITYIHDEHPRVLIILDAKKGDIGNTSKAYARAAFDSLGVDSITVNGYMGKDAVTPFSDFEDKLVFVLCRTSNKAASEVQNTPSPDEPLYLKMSEMIDGWNDRNNLGMVVGATFPEELKNVRDRVGFAMPILVPGVGAQGGDLEQVLRFGTNEEGWGILINVSRGIMFAFQEDGGEFIVSAREAALRYHKSITEVMTSLGRW